jgi:hypothetical protein
MPKHSGTEFQKKMKQQRELERQVLLYVRSRGQSVHWDALYAKLDPQRTGDLGSILHLLKAGHYITIDGMNQVAITKLGLKRLESAMF